LVSGTPAIAAYSDYISVRFAKYLHCSLNSTTRRHPQPGHIHHFNHRLIALTGFQGLFCPGPPISQDSVVVRSLDRRCRARSPSPAHRRRPLLSDRETPRSAQSATFHLSQTNLNTQIITKMACDYQYVKEHTREDYVFPWHRFQRSCSPDKTPLCLVACGSFSPITFLQYVFPAEFGFLVRSSTSIILDPSKPEISCKMIEVLRT
jgi:hypothetical protein